MATVDLSPKSVKEVAKAVADLLNPQIAASGAIDKTIIEGPLPGTGAVRYAGYANTNAGQPVFVCDMNVPPEVWTAMDKDQRMTIRRFCGCDENQKMVPLDPAYSHKLDRDPELAVNGQQVYGFISPVYPCIDDPDAPHGFRQSSEADLRVSAMRFPSTEAGLRKAVKFG